MGNSEGFLAAMVSYPPNPTLSSTDRIRSGWQHEMHCVLSATSASLLSLVLAYRPHGARSKQPSAPGAFLLVAVNAESP